VSFLGRILGGADLRRAREAEAGGDYLEAARAYAAAGERPKVAEMHLLASERTLSVDGKLEALREAARWADDEEEVSRRVRRRVAAAMLGWVRARGIITDGDREIVGEAAALFVSAGDAAGAGSCHELLGAAEAAAAAYQSAGEVDRLESLLDGEADRRRRAVALRDALEDQRFRLRKGDPGGALASLDAAIAAADAKERPELERARRELVARRLPPGRLCLVGEPTVLVAPPPLIIGRSADAALTLRDSGVSRHHLELRNDTGWQVVDLGAKNGTTLEGEVVLGTRPLPERGTIGVGELCALAFSIASGVLSIEIARGLDRGKRLISSSGTVRVAAGGRPLVEVRFADRRARLGPCSYALFVNGSSVTAEIEPLIGDVLEVGTVRWQVSA
jgi:hypothetical protein